MAVKFIDSIDDQTLDAEQSSFRGGVDEFQPPHRLPDGVGGQLVNCLVEDNGRPRSRPGADKINNATLSAGKTVKTLCYFDTPATEKLFAAVDASLRAWDRANWATVGGYPFGSNDIIEMAQGNDVLYTSDGVGHWFSYPGTGGTWTDLGGSNTGTMDAPPVGASIMCWHTNRMFANAPTSTIQDQIAASKLNDAGATKWDWPSFSFRVGRGEGQAITALISGKGFWLMVGKESSLYAVNADPAAATAADWSVQRISDSVGVTGKRAACMFGDSLMILSRDGIREITATNYVEAPFEVTPPLSEPVQVYIDRVNWAVASKAILRKYRHYLFIAVPLDDATENSHVLVWNGRTRTWMGVWTGWTPASMATTRFGAEGERLVFGDTAGFANAFKDYASDNDARYTENGARVAGVMRARSWDFGSQRNWKDGAAVEFQFVNSSGKVTLVVVYDGIEQQTWVEDLGTGSGLVLPFTLPQTLGVRGPGRPRRITKSLDALGQFKEMYAEVRSDGHRVELKSISAEAYLNTIDTE